MRFGPLVLGTLALGAGGDEGLAVALHAGPPVATLEVRETLAVAEMAELLGQPAAFHSVDAFTVAGPRNDLIAAEHEVKKRISVGMIELGGG